MLRVKTKLGKSSIHGIGLFADEFIPKGTVTWHYDPELDSAISAETLESEPQVVKDFLLHYCYFDYDLNKFVLCSDNQRHINHTQDKSRENIMSSPQEDVALRDIKEGEELLCDYNKFDNHYFERVGIPKEALK